MTITTYPLDNIDYSADDAALYHCTRSSGVYAGDDFSYSVTGADNNVTVGAGLAWMRLARFKGVVSALKTDTTIDLGLPDSALSRIDHVILQYDANKNVVDLVVKKGSAGSAPIPPERAVTESLYELHLLQVRREPSATSVTAADITDLRLNSTYCGLMADSVTSIDTAAIDAQISALIAQLREDIAAVKAGTAFVMKSGDTMTGNLSIPAPVEASHAANKEYVDSRTKKASVILLAGGWSGEAPYIKQSVACEGVTVDNDVVISVATNMSYDNMTVYGECNVRCQDQWNGALDFYCDETPGIDLTVNVLILN